MKNTLLSTFLFTGFTGQFCESEINACDSGPCLNGAVCMNDVKGFDCFCPEGKLFNTMYFYKWQFAKIAWKLWGCLLENLQSILCIKISCPVLKFHLHLCPSRQPIHMKAVTSCICNCEFMSNTMSVVLNYNSFFFKWKSVSLTLRPEGFLKINPIFFRLSISVKWIFNLCLIKH